MNGSVVASTPSCSEYSHADVFYFAFLSRDSLPSLLISQRCCIHLLNDCQTSTAVSTFLLRSFPFLLFFARKRHFFSLPYLILSNFYTKGEWSYTDQRSKFRSEFAYRYCLARHLHTLHFEVQVDEPFPGSSPVERLTVAKRAVVQHSARQPTFESLLPHTTVLVGVAKLDLLTQPDKVFTHRCSYKSRPPD